MIELVCESPFGLEGGLSVAVSVRSLVLSSIGIVAWVLRCNPAAGAGLVKSSSDTLSTLLASTAPASSPALLLARLV
jgi:hypothetical protein